jgi:hypothetical protein
MRWEEGWKIGIMGRGVGFYGEMEKYDKIWNKSL